MTRTAAAERAELVRVESCDIALDLARGDERFGSTSVIRFSCTRPGAASYADLQADDVREVILNGRRLDPAQVGTDGRIALAGLAESNELRVTADFRYTSDGSALHRSADPADGKVHPRQSAGSAGAQLGPGPGRLVQGLAADGRPGHAAAGFQRGRTREFTSFAVLQDAPGQHPVLRPHRVTIGLYQRTSGALACAYRAGERRAADLMAVALSFSQGDHARLLAPYAAEYFARMPALWAARTGFARSDLVRALFPYTAAAPGLLRQVDEFLAGPAREPGLARIVTEGRDAAAKALRARTLPG